MPRNQGTSRKGKPKKNERAAGMGRALQKSGRKKHTPSASTGGMAMRQGVDSLNVTQEDNRASVLDMNDLDDFLIQAEMANREFASQKEQFVMLDETTQQAAGDDEPSKTITWADQPENKNTFAFQELSVPRRPAWDETTTPEELDKREKESFLEWRRAIAKKEEEILFNEANNPHATSPLGVTPFEKNIEIWKQLWRVMERVSCIVQIVDARNPLFYLSKDLKTYATQELGKPMLLLVNKSDYLTPRQRKEWHEFFSDPEHPWEHVFFSAHDQQEILDQEYSEQLAAQAERDMQMAQLLPDEADEDEEAGDGDDPQATEETEKTPSGAVEDQPNSVESRNVGVETPLSRKQLLDWLLNYAAANQCAEDPKYNRIPFGMVGFPNVGKSSVINVLMGNAKSSHGVVRVGVAAQPGKTKHFQTLLLPDHDNMLLCDCPGLVFPSFVSNTADLIAAGVYPIAQMRDPWPVVSLLCKRIPRQVLNAQYGIQIPMPTADAMLEAEDGSIPSPTAEEFLTTYCVARSMLASASGIPDFQRASRIVIKEYAAGKLLYCHAPPTSNDELFQQETLKSAMRRTRKLRDKLPQELSLGDTKPADSSEFDNDGEDDDDSQAEDDQMLLDLLGDIGPKGANPQESKQNAGTRKKKWGKKGRKLRNKDPYGCHSTPDDGLQEDDGPIVGVSVKGGKKRGQKNYVRPKGYGNQQVTGTRSAG